MCDVRCLHDGATSNIEIAIKPPALGTLNVGLVESGLAINYDVSVLYTSVLSIARQH